MRRKLDRFLTITALVASASALAVACTSEDVDTNTDGGVGGAGGSSGGFGGTAGSDASTAGMGGQATGGTAGAGTGGTAGAATGGTGGQCLGDTGNPLNCANLPYAGDKCMGNENDGDYLCAYLQAHGRPGVAEAVGNCLFDIDDMTTPICDQSGMDEVQKCIDDNYGKACDPGPINGGDAGTLDPCGIINTNCPNVTVQVCETTINAYDEATRLAILQCVADNKTGIMDCGDELRECAFAIDDYP